MDTEQKITLITDRLAEITDEKKLRNIVSERPLNIYWGTAPTGRIHIGYLIPLLKIADFLRAGCEVKILLADIHAMLDNLKSTEELVAARTTYYEEMIKIILLTMNVPLENLKFVKGSTFQGNEFYITDMLKLSTLTSIRNAKQAGAEVVKQTENPKLSNLLYPLFQALDEHYMKVDAELGGIDQRKIFMFASDNLEKIGLKHVVYMMNPMLMSIGAKPPQTEKYSTDHTKSIESLHKIIKQMEDNVDPSIIASNLETIAKEINIDVPVENKMSSSDTNSKIDFLDSKNEIKKKINAAYCLEGDITFNPLMELMHHIIFPLMKLTNLNQFCIDRKEQHGGPIIYDDLDNMKKDFVEKKLHPQDLKLGIINFLNAVIEPVRNKFNNDPDLLKLIKNAYP